MTGKGFSGFLRAIIARSVDCEFPISDNLGLASRSLKLGNSLPNEGVILAV